MSTLVRQRSIDTDLFEWPSKNPALQASRCNVCNSLAFPIAKSCMSCGSEKVSVEKLPIKGVLWTWTVQRFMPKEPYNSSETPETFKPYGLGYIDFPGALRIESRLMESDPEKLSIGMEVELVFYTHRLDDDGTEVINYAYKPV